MSRDDWTQGDTYEDSRFMKRVRVADKIGAGFDPAQDTSREFTADEDVQAFVQAQKDAGIKRENLKLPCGEYMIARGFDDSNDATDYDPTFDTVGGAWEWSDKARAENPGLARVAKGIARRPVRELSEFEQHALARKLDLMASIRRTVQ